MKKLLALLFLFTALSHYIQSVGNTSNTRVITGIVLSEEDMEPVIGANIYIKGTTTGTISYLDGDFTLKYTPTGNDILVVSYIGMQTQEIPLTNKNHYQIILKGDYQTLEEVVVVAYGVTRKETITGAMAVGQVADIAVSGKEKENTATTWKRSGMKDNSIRLQIGAEHYLPLEAVQMAVQIDGFRVRVLMDCFFYNDKGSGLEGTFKLKLPTDATPFYFAFGETEYLDSDEEDQQISRQLPYINYDKENFNLTYQGIEDMNDREWRRVKEARIVSKQKAAKAYEKTVSAAIDPALMEWGGADMFSGRVYPLENNTLHRIVIGYDLNMTEALDFREYILSLPKAEKELKLDMNMYHSARMESSVSPTLQPTDQEEDRLYYSITNPTENEYMIRYDQVDPVLLVQPDDYTEEVNIPYFAANYRVELPEIPQENLPGDAIFLLDVSISSNPDKFNIWLKLFEEILENNRDIIRQFAILTFNIEQRWYNRYFMKNSYHNQLQALEYLNTLALEGATDLASAIEEASNPTWLKKNKNRPKHIFLLSDGDCNWGETSMYKFKNLLHPGDRVHTYKTGLSGTNTAVLNYLSRISDGFAFTVTGEEEARLTAASFRYKPWNIEHMEVGETEDFLISGNPVQLYNGQKLIFTGREIPDGEIRIDVTNGIEKRQLVYQAKEIITSALVSRIYGQVASAYLENYGYQAEEAAVNYSTYYRVPGQYTSLLMLENQNDYWEWGIDDGDAELFVSYNMVSDLIKELEEKGATALLGDGKTDFLRWIEHLQEEVIDKPSGELEAYLKALPDEVFKVKIKPRHYNVAFAEQQDTYETEMLADEDIRFDHLFRIARRRSYQYGKPDGLKLLSSVVERNAADLQAIRDVAMTAIDWNLPEHAYYMMRRIIDWREAEGLAYITAADALAKAGYVELALIYYYLSIETDWDDDYGSLPTMAALKCLRYLNQLKNDKKQKLSEPVKAFLPYIRKVAIEELETEGFEDTDEADIVIMVSWSIDNTDIDLHVKEPTGEICYYGNSETEIGGSLSVDVTDGYGPEMYVLKKAVPGRYSVYLDYFSDSGLQTASKAKAYIEVYRNWGRKNEKYTRKVVELRSGEWDDYDPEEDKWRGVMNFYMR